MHGSSVQAVDEGPQRVQVHSGLIRQNAVGLDCRHESESDDSGTLGRGSQMAPAAHLADCSKIGVKCYIKSRVCRTIDTGSGSREGCDVVSVLE